MMKNGHILALLIGILFAGAGMAQSSGSLRLLVDPGSGFQFIVDKKHRMEQREVTLTEGLHELTIWAPQRMMVDTPVFVIADRTSDLVVRLPYSPEYLAYASDLSKFQRKRRRTRAIPIVTTVAGLAWSVGALDRYKTADEQLQQDQADYDLMVDPERIGQLKDVTMPEHKQEFKESRTEFYIASGVTLLSAAATWYVFRLTSGWERPVFEDKQKVLFDGLSWMPSDHGGTWAVGLTFPIR